MSGVDELAARWRGWFARILDAAKEERIRNGLDKVRDAALGAPEDGRERTLVQLLFPWPIRVAFVVVAFWMGYEWHRTSLGVQLSWGFDYAALIMISLTASVWVYLLVINFLVAIIWVGLSRKTHEEGRLWWWVTETFTFLNRQVGHIEAFTLWIVISLATRPDLKWQLTFLVAVLLLGEAVINTMTRLYFLLRKGVLLGQDELLPARRPAIYAASFLALFWLFVLGWSQWKKLIPIILVAASGVVPRLYRHRMMRTRGAAAQASNRSQRRAALHLDVVLGPLAVLAGLGFVVMGAHLARARYERGLLSPGLFTSGACDDAHGGPVTTDVGLFIVSDSQFHELGGERFPGQLEFADALVPVALRPVELDILSVATLAHFGDVYHALAKLPTGDPPKWAHLGDLADLSCKGELERADAALAQSFGARSMAGLSPGNHDKSFTGNFYFNPYWARACRSGPLEKTTLEDMLVRKWSDGLDGHMHRIAPGWLDRRIDCLTHKGGALITVTPLGMVDVRGDQPGQRGLIGIFLDSSDGDVFDWGIAGVFGTISDGQVAAVLRLTGEITHAQGGYQDPVYVIFAHHPLASLTSASRRRFDDMVAKLDGREGATRVLAVITAHTHVAEARSNCIGGRVLPEFIVGSTIDPPQQASMVEVGPDARGALSLRLRTVQAVARPGLTCGQERAVSAADCEHEMARLAEAPECAPLFRRQGGEPGPDCRAMEQPTSAADRLRAAARAKVPIEPSAIFDEQKRRAGSLLACICRGNRCDPDTLARATQHLDDQAYTNLIWRLIGAGTLEQPELSGAARTPEQEGALRELTCLSWAASAVQAHKGGGMEMADGLRCAFADLSLPPAQEYVAHLERLPCR
jgi:hypothetical protein